MNPFPNRLRPQQVRPQLPDPNVGAAPQMTNGFDQRLQMMQQRVPGFAYDPAMKWGQQVSAAMHARNAARRPQQAPSMMPSNPNPSGSPVPQTPNPFRPHGRPY
jgi:hypothetical protein